MPGRGSQEEASEARARHVLAGLGPFVLRPSGANHVWYVGRDARCDLCVPGDPELSRRHLRVACERGRFTVEDLGSRNGTRANGVLLPPGAPHTLADGDLVEVGRTRLLFRWRKAPAPASGRRSAPLNSGSPI